MNKDIKSRHLNKFRICACGNNSSLRKNGGWVCVRCYKIEMEFRHYVHADHRRDEVEPGELESLLIR